MDKILNTTISSWAQFVEIMTGSDYKSWAFRGHSDADWPILSTLSRYLKTYNIHPEVWPVMESRILRIFKRKAHLFLTHIPQEKDDLEWLALMQHHGTPTRLLDFTWSPYVAAFFALERATKDAAVWAVFPPKLIKDEKRGPWIQGNYVEYFLPNTQELIVICEPRQMNQRLIAQSGTFIIPGVLDKSIENTVPADSIVKFTFDTDKMRKQAMVELYNMNITNATLFPGLDGLARSLAYELEFHWAFDTTTLEPRKGYEKKN